MAKACEIYFENFVLKARWLNLGNCFKKMPDNKTVVFFSGVVVENTILQNIHQRGGQKYILTSTENKFFVPMARWSRYGASCPKRTF